jgi:5-formyltetrahydrofolate cyclo-ligase
MEIQDEKKEVRRKVRELKRMLSPEEREIASTRIFSLLEELEHFRSAKTILVYWSLDDEVQTHSTAKKWSAEKKILLPVVYNEILLIREFSGEHNLKKSEKLTLMEPAGNNFTLMDQIDLAVVPGMAFDRNYNRLGRGKGYYDKLLPNLTKAFKIGVCFDTQLFEGIPVEKYDIKMDMIITEKAIL